MTRAVFVACSAYSWDPTDPKNATFSIVDNGPRITIDSTMRPDGGLRAETAIVDDYDGGATSVDKKGDTGGLYVEFGYAIAHRYPMIPPGYEGYKDRDYEFKTIQYSTKDGLFPGYRYYGFHAIWTSGPINHAKILIYNAGESLSPFVDAVQQHIVDLDNKEIFLPETESGYLRPQAGDGSGGAIFVRCREAQNWKLSLPKLPQSQGSTDRKIVCPKLDS
ncbi:MAG: hypothetical protein JNK64_12915 [Myxococcales bacterium]|nr:hypothetical protein [Myxococcales bacterium]